MGKKDRDEVLVGPRHEADDATQADAGLAGGSPTEEPEEEPARPDEPVDPEEPVDPKERTRKHAEGV